MTTTGGTGRAMWNQYTGGAWQLTEVTNNDFVTAYLVATNDPDQPMIILVGQQSYTSVRKARNGIEDEVDSLVTDGLPTPEFRFIAAMICQTSNGYANTPQTRIRSIETGVDYLNLTDVRSRVISSTVTSLDAANVIVDASAFAGILSATDTDAQTALDTIDVSGGGAIADHTHVGLPGDGGLVDHGSLSGRGADGHLQYHTDARGDARYYTQAQSDAAYAPVAEGVTNGDAHDHVGGDGAQIDHGGTAGLGDDDHTQYHTDARGDARYYTQAQVDGGFAPAAEGVTNGNAHNHVGGDGGTIDHGGLSGRGDDDHSQYHTDARGDARYYTQALVDAKFSGTTGTIQKDNGTGLTDSVIRESSSKIGIGVSPSYALDVYTDGSAAWAAQIFNDNAAGYGLTIAAGPDSAASNQYILRAQRGDKGTEGYLKIVAGTFQLLQSSDERKKQDIRPTTQDALATLAKLQVIQYRRKPTTDRDGHVGKAPLERFGFGASQVRGAMPEMTSEDEHGDLFIAPTVLIPVLTRAIQQQQSQIDALEARLAKLEAKR